MLTNDNAVILVPSPTMLVTGFGSILIQPFLGTPNVIVPDGVVSANALITTVEVPVPAVKLITYCPLVKPVPDNSWPALIFPATVDTIIVVVAVPPDTYVAVEINVGTV